MENSSPRILIAPLNWGLGHATRCIPIIKQLIHNNFNPIIASDGIALTLLKKEFPELLFLELPSYQIEYAKNGAFFKWKLIKNSPKMIKAIMQERKLTKKWVKEYGLSGVISDNRLGVYSKKIPSVFITHQLNVLTGSTSWISSKVHQYIIKKYTQCWVPDVVSKPNLSGKLGHLKKNHLKISYLGPLSRFEKKDYPLNYNLMILLSGPEPQRGMLEDKLLKECLKYQGKILFVRGVVSATQKLIQRGSISLYNFMTSEQLEQAIQESELILCRSGYTTVMDLSKLEKKAFFIPTPGQFEQEYLALKYKKEGWIPYSKQDDFRIENLLEIDLYKGLPKLDYKTEWEQLFRLFKSKGKL